MTGVRDHPLSLGPAPGDGRSALLRRLVGAVGGDLYWEPYLGALIGNGTPPYALHLGVFVEPFLKYVLEGRKTVESRFSRRRFAPYQQVAPGDVVLIKRAGGPIVGLCRVADAWFYRLDPDSWESIRSEFGAMLCAQDPAFWEGRQWASFASLMRIDRVRPVPPLPVAKRDRRGWAVLISARSRQPALIL